ncbi:MAG TPA: NAD(P)/FAD-dependent oxidoreductase [Nitrososphaerales archaeon]|nr:NAD(P)/FAD-dependent oxidoreductase [Nitrososphaerales archaeon]
MTKVAIIGAGTAGYEAAAEASRNEAEVVLLERSDSWEPSWHSWPDLLHSPEHSERPPTLPNDVELIHGADVTSIGPGSFLTADGRRAKFDSVVIGSGGEFMSVVFPGRRKRGVVILDNLETYAELGRERSSMARVVIRGEGVHALQVADGLSGIGRKVTLLAASRIEGFASEEVGDVVRDAAAGNGVSIIDSKLDGAVGCGHVEAVIAGGTIVPCDTLAVLPARGPRVPLTSAETGLSGGLLVDRHLRSSSPVLYAAGWTAEPRVGLPRPRTLGGAAAKSGRVAGANATGHRLVFHPPRFAEASFFGLRWARFGNSLCEARGQGLIVSEISHRWSQGSACTIAYERPSGKLVGVELVVEEGNERLGFITALTPPTSLQAMAYGVSSDSSDISLVSDTARLGLQAWSGS